MPAFQWASWSGASMFTTLFCTWGLFVYTLFWPDIIFVPGNPSASCFVRVRQSRQILLTPLSPLHPVL
jgi:hypothetical protein